MDHNIVLLITALLHLLAVSLSFQSHNPFSGCHISIDDVYGGVKVNCTASGLSSRDLPHLRMANATTLILNLNQIYDLGNHSFHGTTNLVRLLIAGCELDSIHPYAFRGLNRLQYLDLNQNHLKFQENSLPFHVFDTTPNLNTLVLNRNDYYTSNKTYSQALNIFNSLGNLTTLFIDSLTDLYIGHAFSKLQRLHKLYISCRYLEHVYNVSLEGLASSSIKELILDSGIQVFYQHFNVDVFAPLPDLDVLEVRRFHIGNDRVLESMKGLQGKTIHNLTFFDLGQTSSTEASAYANFMNGYIRENSTRYLANICVHNFVWSHSDIKGIEASGMFKQTWATSLRTLDVSGNHMFYGHMAGVYRLVEMKSLERLCTSRSDYPTEDTPFWKRPDGSTYYQTSGKDSPFTYNSPTDKTIADVPSYSPSSHASSSSSSFISSTSFLPQLRVEHTLLSKLNTKPHPKFYPGPEPVHFQSSSLAREMTPLPESPTNKTADLFSLSGRTMWLPKKLTSLLIDNVYSLNFEYDVTIHWPNSLQKLYIRDITLPANRWNGAVRGLRSLKLADFAGSDVRMRLDVFDDMPSLEKLSLRSTQYSPDFLQDHADRLFIHNFNLEYLDLSENGLDKLPPATFEKNPNLRYLCLSSNRFSQIPFDLRSTPNLEILDLRSNSFVGMSKMERDAVDAHRKNVQNFTILLQGNALVCTCSTHDFVFWLSRTFVRFDKDGNYSCSMEDGATNYMMNMNNVAIQRRRCRGPTYFMISLSVAFALVAIYMGVFLVTRYKKLIISKALRVLSPGFKILSRADFVYDVLVGYSDADVMFVRYTLLPYLEGKWKLRTFIRHRDLLQDPLDMTRAIQDSWRCVLIITEDFLQKTEMGHNVMKNATFFVSPSNLKKVLVIVEERVQYDVPDYVLQVVDEDSVIVVPDLNTPLDYETVETLRNRILE